MILALIICILTGVGVFLTVLLKPELRVGKIVLGTYWVVSLTGAILLLATGSIPFSELLAGLVDTTSAINPIKILTLFISMTALSVFLDEIGFFRYLAGAVLSKAGGSQKVLFLLLFITVSVLTVFTSNDIVVLTFTPFICCFARNAKINPLPYLIAEFVASNTWSMTLIIGNPTNIYIASSAGVTFFDYVKVMAIPSILAGTASFFILYFLFRRQLNTPIERVENTEKIEDKPALIIGLLHLGICTILLAVGSYVELEMWLISLVFALSLFVCFSVLSLIRRKKPSKLLSTVKRLPYELIPFVLSMFTVVLSLEHHGLTGKLAELLGESGSVFSYGVLSYLAANFINNIPMSVLFSSVLESGVLSGSAYLGGVYATTIGSNLGAYLTPVGALAGIMWASILKKEKVEFSFLSFIKYGVIISIPTLFVSLLSLTLFV